MDLYEILDVILGTNAEPQPTPDPANPGSTLPLDVDLLWAWKRKNAEALCALVTSTMDSILTLIQHTTKAPEAWNILKGQYETQNQTRIQNLENQLAMEKFNEGETAEAFITRIKNLCDLMAGARIKKSSKDLAWKCLLVCPPKFDGLVTTLNTQVRPSPLTFEDFCALLQEEELRIKAREEGGLVDVALSTIAKDKGNSNSKVN